MNMFGSKIQFRKEHLLKILLVYLIFENSILLTSLFHEYGHATVYYVFGCKEVRITLYRLNAPEGVYANAKCLDENIPSPENYIQKYGIIRAILETSGGVMMNLFLGITFLLLFKYSKFINKNYVLSLFAFSLAFTNILDVTFYQLATGPFYNTSDIYQGISYYNWNPNFISIIGVLLTVFVIYILLKEFKYLLRIVETKITKSGIKIWYIILIIFITYNLYSGILFVIQNNF